ncbi:MAG: dialkylresorcinol condensing enzyme [Campylobacterales bacterium]|nr:dialkylresorcinol condensing enzyme [Campylobacterales bacterium]
MNQKKVLVVSYSQTGQLTKVVNNFTKLFLEDESIQIVHKNIKPKKSYPFPWDLMTFMDTFPESVHLVACEIEDFEDDNDYDLIILSYQVWFLSPSIPVTSFLKSDWAKKKFANKPVITLIGCRNMWIMAQEKMKQLLIDLNANLIDNVVLIDKGNSLETFITTPRWMLTGKKNSILGLSTAGIDENEIVKSQRFGKALLNALKNNKEKENKSLLWGLKAVEVNAKLIKSEKIATKSFLIWGSLIRKLGKPGSLKRKPIVMLYLVFLLFMIITVVPINMIIQSILRIVNEKSVKKQKEFYELPSGSSEERMKDFQ